MKILAQELVAFHKDDKLVEVCAIEELSELIKEITKHQRGMGNKQHLIEELGHVMLLCNALMVQYSINEGAVFREAEKAVQKMLDSRIKDEPLPTYIPFIDRKFTNFK